MKALAKLRDSVLGQPLNTWYLYDVERVTYKIARYSDKMCVLLGYVENDAYLGVLSLDDKATSEHVWTFAHGKLTESTAEDAIELRNFVQEHSGLFFELKLDDKDYITDAFTIAGLFDEPEIPDGQEDEDDEDEVHRRVVADLEEREKTVKKDEIKIPDYLPDDVN